MIYYCQHYKDKITTGKAMHYCLKQNCWALKIFKNHKMFKTYHNKLKGGEKK